MRVVRYLLVLLLASIVYASDIVLEMVVEPQERLTTNWCFLYDNSHSMRGVFSKSKQAFLEATKHPTDELHFSVISFNNEGNTVRQDWQPASKEAFDKTEGFLDKNKGILSYGIPAIRSALSERGKHAEKLTIVLITDGAFTEGFPRIKETFELGQKKRQEDGLPAALLVVLGIENKSYKNKPSDEVCQKFLQDLGRQWGGYWYVKNAMTTVKR